MSDQEKQKKKFFAEDGKAEEILDTIGNVLTFIKPDKSQEKASDYEVGIGDSKTPKSEGKRFPIGLVFLGTLGVVVGGIWLVKKYVVEDDL